MNFVYKHIVTGGSESLLLRVGEKLTNDGEKCNLICFSICEKMEHAFCEANINIIKLKTWTPKKIYNATKGTKTLFCRMAEFLMVLGFCGKNVNEPFFLYIVHPKDTTIFSKKLSCFNRNFRKEMRIIMERLDEADRICYMDEMCIEECERFYKIVLKNARKRILRIPIDTHIKIVKQADKDKLFGVLTISRADYPFKGYVKGLIENLGKLDAPIKLRIVSYGAGIPELEKWINNAQKYKKLNIELIGETSYEKLSDYYADCDVYVGQGTTILEAALQNRICIPVQSYTYEFNSAEFFHENPTNIGTIYSVEQKGILLVKKAISFTQSEFDEFGKKSREKVEELYSFDKFELGLRNMKFYDCNIQLPMLLKVLFTHRLKE